MPIVSPISWEEAFQAMKEGKKVRGIGWPSDRYIFIRKEQDIAPCIVSSTSLTSTDINFLMSQKYLIVNEPKRFWKWAIYNGEDCFESTYFMDSDGRTTRGSVREASPLKSKIEDRWIDVVDGEIVATSWDSKTAQANTDQSGRPLPLPPSGRID